MSTIFDPALLCILKIWIGGVVLFCSAAGLFEMGLRFWEKKTGKTLQGHLRDWEELDD